MAIAVTALESPIALVPLVRPYRPSDYVTLHDQITQATGIRVSPDPHAMANQFGMAGPAFTAFGDGIRGTFLLGSAGLAIQWPGRAVAWAILSPALVREPRLALWFTYALRRRLRSLITEHGLRRVEAMALADHGQAIRWLGALGFKVEGPAPAWGPNGEDAYHFALLPGRPACS